MKMLCHFKDNSERSDNKHEYYTFCSQKVKSILSKAIFIYTSAFTLVITSPIVLSFVSQFSQLCHLFVSVIFENNLVFIFKYFKLYWRFTKHFNFVFSNIVFAKNNIVSGQYKHEHNWPFQLAISLYAFLLLFSHQVPTEIA